MGTQKSAKTPPAVAKMIRPFSAIYYRVVSIKEGTFPSGTLPFILE